ncbi:hypothetical protein G7046_g9041 [Stylonectria norvegica]|nr:hypothetical protein G7046_g9041 [Stylonectria norvegica]
MAFSRLIRFRDEEGTVHFGDLELENADDLKLKFEQQELHAVILAGDGQFDLSSAAGVRKRVAEILPILLPKDVPIVRCIGLNYIKHIQEGGRSPPPYPSVFTKSPNAVASYNEDIPIPKLAQDQLDYEGELAIVVGKTGKNIRKGEVGPYSAVSHEALDYIAGFVVSNDVSARKWQRDPRFAGPVPQWDCSKGFDKYAPLGPILVSPKVLGAADDLSIQMWVNGELRQNSNTSDLLFGVKEIVAFISQGTTLDKGTIIMTGTPAGVAMGMKPEPKYLSNGDIVKLLDMGTLDIDANFLLAGGHENAESASNPNPTHKRIETIIYGVLIKHATAGLILFETGCHDDMEKNWGPRYNVSPRKNYLTKNRLDAQIEATGNSIKDIKAVIMGHLLQPSFYQLDTSHINSLPDADHSGGLMHFLGTDVPIYVHDLELNNALWCLFTKVETTPGHSRPYKHTTNIYFHPQADAGPYMPSYLDHRLNWQTFSDKVTEIFPGITMHHCPGHTTGLCCLQLDLTNDGTLFFTGDQFHVKENYTKKIPQGEWKHSLGYLVETGMLGSNR